MLSLLMEEERKSVRKKTELKIFCCSISGLFLNLFIALFRTKLRENDSFSAFLQHTPAKSAIN